MAAVSQLNSGDGSIIIKVRDRSISKAVDVALMVQDRFLREGQVQSIDIRTEVLDGEDGRSVKVSSIEICLFKPSEKFPVI